MKKEILTLVFAIIPGMQVTAVRTITVVVNPVVHTEAYQGHTGVFFSLFFKLAICYFKLVISNLKLVISN